MGDYIDVRNHARGFVGEKRLISERHDSLKNIESVEGDSPTSAVEFKSHLIYMWTTTQPTVFIFGWSFFSSINRGFHTEVGETGTLVGVVEILYLSYSDHTRRGSERCQQREAARSMDTYSQYNRRSSSGSLALIFCLSLGACSWVPKGDVQLDVGIKDRGVASWYGEQFHGRKAANGELFDMEALTAAHRTMPLGSIVRVINLNNGRHLHVRITDRGPYEKGRILDLSRRAALQLGMEHKGLAYVQVEIVGERRPDLAWLSETFTGQVASALADAQPLPDRTSSGMAAHTRTMQGDLWIARRNRWALAMLSADHWVGSSVATLVLA